MPLYFASGINSIVKKHEVSDRLRHTVLPSNLQIRSMRRMDDATATGLLGGLSHRPQISGCAGLA
jgi:hypothetical protein